MIFITFTSCLFCQLQNKKVCLRVKKMFVLPKGALPHPISECVFCITVHLQRAYLGWPELQRNVENACRNGMWQGSYSSHKDTLAFL